MNRNQLITLWVGAGISVICLIFPKWKMFNEKETIDLGHHSVFNPPIEIVNAKNKKQKRIIRNLATTPTEFLRREKESMDAFLGRGPHKSYGTVRELPKFTLIQDTSGSIAILLTTAILTLALIMTFKSKPAPASGILEAGNDPEDPEENQTEESFWPTGDKNEGIRVGLYALIGYAFLLFFKAGWGGIPTAIFVGACGYLGLQIDRAVRGKW